MTARKRPLSPEDIALWYAVTRSARPLRPEGESTQADAPDISAPDRPALTQAFPSRLPQPAPHAIGSRAVERRRPLPTGNVDPMASAGLPFRIDRRLLADLSRGKHRPDARLDLHGMTASEAHGALNRFVLDAAASGKRLLLVITGKGRESGDHPAIGRQGVLRREVPHWLGLPPLAATVLHVTEAHRRHGGSGAFYVFLRRR
jgi:DNA-nicking Smr family endonuclease